MLLLFQSSAQQPGQHDLTAVGVTTGAPTVGAPALAQVHALVAAALTAGAATLGAPAITQVQVLAATGIATSAPTLAAPALGQVHALTATGAATGAPTLDAPALGGTADELTATDLSAGEPTLAAAAFGQIHALPEPAACECAPPEIGAPAISILGAITLPDTPTYRPILTPFDAREDRDFEVQARVTELADELDELARFTEEAESAYVDVIDNDPFEDAELFGRRSGRRGRG